MIFTGLTKRTDWKFMRLNNLDFRVWTRSMGTRELVKLQTLIQCVPETVTVLIKHGDF